jgi:hypothetical protein
LGPPFRTSSEEMSISAKPKMVPPPCASLNASPVRHASNPDLSSQMVRET